MRERSAVGGSYRKRNKPLSDVGISYMSRCRGGCPGPARPGKCLNGLSWRLVASILLDSYSKPGECVRVRLQEEHP